MPPAAASILAPGVRCLVCGFHDVHTDEVVNDGVIYLAECPRCDYRWTSRAPRPRVRIVAVRAPRARAEVPTAA
jgi:hypothetical protein